MCLTKAKIIAKATEILKICVSPRALLVFCFSTAQRICAISSSRDKNSCHSSAKLSAWWSAPCVQAESSNGVAVMATDQMVSFRGAKRRGNPLNRNVNIEAIATDRTCSRNLYRAEHLCYQFKQGQKLLPQFRQIICLVKRTLCASGEFKRRCEPYL